MLALTLTIVAAGCASGTTASTSSPADPDPERRGPQGRVAQFIVECELSHLAYDDPIVYPNEPGASHLHQFFGNTAVDSDPNYGRVAGADTTCAQKSDTASYWAPALLDGTGNRVEPIGLTAYYRPGDGVDPADVVAYPPSLMMVGGDAHADEKQSTDVVAWSCGSGVLRESEPPPCAPGSTLRMIVTFPDCWDGENMTGTGSGHQFTASNVIYSDNGCPGDHPIAVPQLQITIDYPPVDTDGLTLASGSIITGHADFWNVWDQVKLEGEVANCLNRGLVCGVTD